MNSLTAVEQRFAEARPRLGPHRQQLIRAMVDHCEETCFLSSREVAKRYEVDAATIVRSVQALGYSGFADFADDLRQHLMTRMTPYTALKAATREKRSIADHVDSSLQKAHDNLNQLSSRLDRNQVVELAKLINRSRRVLVVGTDFAASLAFGLAHIDDIAAEHAPKLGLTPDAVKAYLTQNIDYSLDEENRKGLRLFFKLARESGVLLVEKEMLFA